MAASKFRMNSDRSDSEATSTKGFSQTAAGGLLYFSCFGARIAVDALQPELLDLILPILPPNANTESNGRPDHRFSVEKRSDGKMRIVEHQDGTDMVLDELYGLRKLQSMFHDSVAQNARDVVFVHAGVVSWNAGAVVIPGSTMSGKTSLVAALVRQGAEYMSDEFAVLAQDGLVHPYQKPLSVRNTNGTVTLLHAKDLGKCAGQMPVPISLIIDTKYSKDSVWRPERISEGQALMALLANTVSVRKTPGFTMEVLGRAVSGALAYTGSRGDASGACPHILALLEELDS